MEIREVMTQSSRGKDCYISLYQLIFSPWLGLILIISSELTGH